MKARKLISVTLSALMALPNVPITIHAESVPPPVVNPDEDSSSGNSPPVDPANQNDNPDSVPVYEVTQQQNQPTVEPEAPAETDKPDDVEEMEEDEAEIPAVQAEEVQEEYYQIAFDPENFGCLPVVTHVSFRSNDTDLFENRYDYLKGRVYVDFFVQITSDTVVLNPAYQDDYGQIFEVFSTGSPDAPALDLCQIKYVSTDPFGTEFHFQLSQVSDHLMIRFKPDAFLDTSRPDPYIDYYQVYSEYGNKIWGLSYPEDEAGLPGLGTDSAGNPRIIASGKTPVTLGGMDQGSGLDSYIFKWEDSPAAGFDFTSESWQKLPDDDQSYQFPSLSPPAPAEEAYLYAALKDKAGNIGPLGSDAFDPSSQEEILQAYKPLHVLFDDTKPEIKVTANGEEHIAQDDSGNNIIHLDGKGNVLITVSARDLRNSGDEGIGLMPMGLGSETNPLDVSEEEKQQVLICRLTDPDGNVLHSGDSADQNELVLDIPDQNGIYSLTVKASDYLGNASSVEYFFSVGDVNSIVLAQNDRPSTYDRKPVEAGVDFQITNYGSTAEENIHYRYRTSSGSEWTADSLPTNAGTYQIQAYVESPNPDNPDSGDTGYESNVINLTIDKAAIVLGQPRAEGNLYHKTPFQDLKLVEDIPCTSSSDGEAYKVSGTWSWFTPDGVLEYREDNQAQPFRVVFTPADEDNFQTPDSDGIEGILINLVVVPRPQSPALTFTNETVAGKHDGTIAGISENLEFCYQSPEEYQAALEAHMQPEDQDYQPCYRGESEMQNLEPGAYWFRYAGDSGYTGFSVIQIARGRKLKVNIEPALSGIRMSLAEITEGSIADTDVTSGEFIWHDNIQLNVKLAEYLEADGPVELTARGVNEEGAAITDYLSTDTAISSLIGNISTWVLKNIESDMSLSISGFKDKRNLAGKLLIREKSLEDFSYEYLSGPSYDDGAADVQIMGNFFMKVIPDESITSDCTISYALSSESFTPEQLASASWTTVQADQEVEIYSEIQTRDLYVAVKIDGMKDREEEAVYICSPKIIQEGTPIPLADVCLTLKYQSGPNEEEMYCTLSDYNNPVVCENLLSLSVQAHHEIGLGDAWYMVSEEKYSQEEIAEQDHLLDWKPLWTRSEVDQNPMERNIEGMQTDETHPVVVYVKVCNVYGMATFVSTNPVAFDRTDPVIAYLNPDTSCAENPNIQIFDSHLNSESILVNGKAGELEEDEDGNQILMLSREMLEAGTLEISAEDLLGHRTVQTITLLRRHGTLNLENDENSHWYSCPDCSEIFDLNPHASDEDAEWKIDGITHYRLCSECGARSEEAGHTADAAWHYDAGKQWHECTECHTRLDEADHVHAAANPDEWESNTASHYQICSDCHETFNQAGHDEDGVWVAENGRHHQSCRTCQTSILFEDHTPSEAWSYGQGKQWHECEKCQTRLDETDHMHTAADPDSWLTDAASHHQICQDCHEVFNSARHDPDGNWISENGRHWQTCQECGSRILEDLHQPAAAWSYGEGRKWHECTECHAHLDEVDHVHVADELDWIREDSGHYQICTECSEIFNQAGHESNGEWFTEDNTHYQECSVCHLHILSGVHTHNDTWHTDGTSNWRECESCKTRFDLSDHSHWAENPDHWLNDSGSHWQVCKDCNEIFNQVEHEGDGTWIENGGTHHQLCRTCGQITLESEHHADEIWHYGEGKQWHECTECQVKLDEEDHEHQAADKAIWSSDEASHWQICKDCSEIFNKSGHEADGVWIENGTVHHQLCSICAMKVLESGHHADEIWHYGEGKQWHECRECQAKLDERKHEHQAADEGAWSSDEISHWQICTDCSETLSKIGHQPDGKWIESGETHYQLCSICAAKILESGHHADETLHYGQGRQWHECKECQSKLNEEDHEHQAADADVWLSDETAHWQICKDCREVFNKTGHEFDGKWMESGETHHQLCSICAAKILESEHHADEIWHYGEGKQWHECRECQTKLDEGKHEHQAADEGTWLSDDSSHWQICKDCQEIFNKAGHQPDEIWIENGTTHHQLCSVCDAKVLESGHHADDIRHYGEGKQWHECRECQAKLDEEDHEHQTADEGAWSSDETSHWQTCKDCSESFNKTGHEPDGKWMENEETHYQLCSICAAKVLESGHHADDIQHYGEGKQWHECRECQAKLDEEDHEHQAADEGAWSSDETSHWQICTDCREIFNKTGHEPDGKWMESGETHDQLCSICAAKVLESEHHADEIWHYGEGKQWHECTKCQAKLDEEDHEHQAADADLWLSDDSSHWQTCKDCSETFNKTGHEPDGKWMESGETHYQLCSICAAKVLESEHHADEIWHYGEGKQWHECKECQAKLDEEDHEHQAADEGTWLSDDSSHWQTCKDCSETFNKTGHEPDGKWRETEETHYQLCSICDAKILESEHHTDELHYADGKQWYECKECQAKIDEADHVHQTADENEWFGNDSFHWHICDECQDSFNKTEHEADDQWQSDEVGHWKMCQICNRKTNAGSHTHDGQWHTDGVEFWRECQECQTRFDTGDHQHEAKSPDTWFSDETSHWQICESCTRKFNVSLHDGDFHIDSTHEWQECLVCGIRFHETAHEHVTADPDEWISDGVDQWKICLACGEAFDRTSHGHTAGHEWLYDDNAHWRICSMCGQTFSSMEHSFDSEIPLDVTLPDPSGTALTNVTIPGVKTCHSCGYMKMPPGSSAGTGADMPDEVIQKNIADSTNGTLEVSLHISKSGPDSETGGSTEADLSFAKKVSGTFPSSSTGYEVKFPSLPTPQKLQKTNSDVSTKLVLRKIKNAEGNSNRYEVFSAQTLVSDAPLKSMEDLETHDWDQEENLLETQKQESQIYRMTPAFFGLRSLAEPDSRTDSADDRTMLVIDLPQLTEDGQYWIYVRITYSDGSVLYIVSDGIEIDKTRPDIQLAGNSSGSQDEEVVLDRIPEISVEDKNLIQVKVNGIAVDLNEDGHIIIPDELQNFTGTFTVEAVDEAGNVSSLSFTVKPGDPQENPDNPNQPDDPESPDNPENPDQPDNPDNPHEPENPDNPKPSVPDDPDLSHGSHSSGGNPVGPSHPSLLITSNGSSFTFDKFTSLSTWSEADWQPVYSGKPFMLELRGISSSSPVYYLISHQKLSREQLLKNDGWKAWQGPLNLEKDGTYHAYFKQTGFNSQIYVLAAPALIIDQSAPVTPDTVAGKIYAKFPNMKFVEKGLQEIRINGHPVTLLAGGTIDPASLPELKAGPVKVEIKDAAGNHSVLEFVLADISTDSGQITSGWNKLKDGSWIYVKADCSLIHDDQVHELEWNGGRRLYRFDSRGHLITRSWKQSADGSWMYFDGSGAAKQNAWLFLNGSWYYFDPAARMVTGRNQIHEYGMVNIYHFRPDGALQMSVWIKNPDGTWSYADHSGKLVSGWKLLLWNGREDWYYFGSDRNMVTNCWIGDDYVGRDGTWQTA